MIIAWTYLLHAHYREKKTEYRYFYQKGKKRFFCKTKHGSYKYWELIQCLKDTNCPIDNDTKNNLHFLIELRHEIEHQMTTRIDDVLSARFQACCLNYNQYIKKLFSEKLGIDRHLSFSLQFSTISVEQKNLLKEYSDLPANIQCFIKKFDESLSVDEFESPRFAYRILFIPKTANRKGQADRVIEFVKDGSLLAEAVNKEYVVIKDTEKRKYLPKQVVDLMKSEGYKNFSVHCHTKLWKDLGGKNLTKGYGAMVAGKVWHWYDTWVDEVRKHCKEHMEE